MHISTRFRNHWIGAFFVVLAMAVSQPVNAGLGPENICVVVNSRSWASLSVANHYVQWRQIPARNIVHIDWPGPVEVASLADFRSELLTPVLKELKSRGLASQIDAIVYSSDFPYAVRFDNGSPPADSLAVASITSMTAFAPVALVDKEVDFRQLLNPYAVKPLASRDEPVRGFRSNIAHPGDGEGHPIYLSTMLAYTSGRGNSMREALSYLKRAAAADSSSPKGTIYYCVNDDVRSKTRDRGYKEAVDQLRRLGVKAEIVSGEMPVGRRDVQGAMLGVAAFSWRQSKSVIRPGAICEHLTSYGGIMQPRKGQTPLTEMLRFGAAGASGTVVEPYALPNKFPAPTIHVCYAQGVTLAEAFYLSVATPGQLLVVGDPLCAPWLPVSEVDIVGLVDGESITDARDLTVKIRDTKPGYRGKECEWFVDGLRMARTSLQDAYRLDPNACAAGYHELRAVVTSEAPQACKARAIRHFQISAPNRELEWKGPATVHWGETVDLHLEAKGALAIEVFHDSTMLERVDSPNGKLTIDTKRLGLGPVRLGVSIAPNDGGAKFSYPPRVLEVLSPLPLSNRRTPMKQELVPGLKAEWGAGKSATLVDLTATDTLVKVGIPVNTDYRICSWFDIGREELYQFQTRFNGNLRLSVDEQVLFDSNANIREQFYVPVALRAGLHFLEITGNSGARPPWFDLRFGDTPVDYPKPSQFLHVK